MPFWLFMALVIGVPCAAFIPLYLLWWARWDRRMQSQAESLWPEDEDEQRRATWQLLRSLEGPRLPWRIKIDLSDMYAKRHGRKP